MNVDLIERTKKRLKHEIERDAEYAAQRVARGEDPTIQAREHLARTGKLHRQLKDIEGSAPYPKGAA